MTEDRSWALFRHMHFYDEPVFAAKLIGRTAKMVSFEKRPERDDSEVLTRKLNWLLLDGLTEAQAKEAAASAKESLDQLVAERRESQRQHDIRVKIIVDLLRIPVEAS